MKSALSDFISGKKGIYGILHIIILIMSLFLVISISVDTFRGIPFYTQSSYMKVQLFICLWFLFDFVLEFFLAKHKGRYLRMGPHPWLSLRYRRQRHRAGPSQPRLAAGCVRRGVSVQRSRLGRVRR